MLKITTFNKVSKHKPQPSTALVNINRFRNEEPNF